MFKASVKIDQVISKRGISEVQEPDTRNQTDIY